MLFKYSNMKIIILSIFSCCFFTSMAQSITIKDDVHKQDGASPYSPIYENTYGQTIYYESEIQAKGLITAVSYYSNDSSMAYSDLIDMYIGITSVDFLYDSIYIIKRAKMTSVFNGSLNLSSGLPGWVTIQLTTPFYYNGDSNLVIAINETRTGLDAKNYSGSFKRVFGNKLRSACIEGSFLPIDLNYIESMPPNTYPSTSWLGTLADAIFHGLTRNTCWTPQKLRFSNLTDHSAKMMWSPPDSGNVPAAYDVYFGNSRVKPLKTTIADSTNIADTQLVVNNLSPNTRYYAWVRSRCSSTDKSVWTLIDSFTTLCTSIPIPTAVEPFNTYYVPNCWTLETGKITSQTHFREATPSASQRWIRNKITNTPLNYVSRVTLSSDSTAEWLLSPSYDLGTGPNKSLEFDCGTDAPNGLLEATDAFAVVISTDNGFTWSSANILRIWYFGSGSLSTATTGQHVSISLSSYNGPVRIGFYARRQATGSTSLINIWVDNVQITGVMPVTLLAFTGTKEGTTNLLKWRTATEQNNTGFELQRSSNGTDFSRIVFVPTKSAAGGNSSATLSYAYTDNSPLTTHNCFYRLKQVDLDGKFTFSNTVFIKGEAVTELVVTSLYPNPTNQLLNVVLEAPAAQRVQLVITDLAGKTVQQQTLELQKGTNSKTVKVAALAKGTYVAKVVCANGCEAAVRKFVKE